MILRFKTHLKSIEHTLKRATLGGCPELWHISAVLSLCVEEKGLVVWY
jgi:hypothetical protein